MDSHNTSTFYIKKMTHDDDDDDDDDDDEVCHFLPQSSPKMRLAAGLDQSG